MKLFFCLILLQAHLRLQSVVHVLLELTPAPQVYMHATWAVEIKRVEEVGRKGEISKENEWVGTTDRT